MLQTNGSKPTLAIGGINQQDFKEIQLVAGTFPYQKGLQKRIPGKSLISINPNGVGSIYVFYLVYGRHYNLIDFGTSISITETPLNPITLPALPGIADTWFDNFAGYSDDLVSRLWGAGMWATGIGVCETLIEGVIDPFLVFATISPGRENPIPSLQPIPGPTGASIPNTTPASFPIGSPDPTQSKVFIGETIVGPNLFPFPSANYPIDNSGWLPGGAGDMPFLTHPAIYDPLNTSFFSAQEFAKAQSFYNGSSQVQEFQQSNGWYSDNLVDPSVFTANDGDIVTLTGTQSIQTDRFGTMATSDVEVVLGIYPLLPERFTVNINLGPKISDDISSPPGSNRLNLSKKTLTYTGYNVYPPA